MRAIHRTTSMGNQRHNGRYATDTAVEKNDAKIDEAYEDRLVELRLNAKFMLHRMPELTHGALLHVTITQVGKKGFYWKLPGEPIPKFEPWLETTLLENERIFNART